MIEWEDDDYEEECTWGWSKEQDERIGKVIAGIDDEDYTAAFDTWEKHLKNVLKLPFEAEVSEYQERGSLKCGDKVVVRAIESSDDLYGIIVRINSGRKELYFPLCDLKAADEKSANYTQLFDYDVWFANR